MKSSSITRFVDSVLAAFNLTKVVDLAEMAGSANRLWKLTTSEGSFVIKELPYNDHEEYLNLRKAAAFEANVIGQRLVAGAQPVPDRWGEYVVPLPNSRGQESPIRLHRWYAGTTPNVDDPAILLQAGRTLRTIQRAGASWATRPNGSLQRWSCDPVLLLERLVAEGSSGPTSHSALRRAMAEALTLAQAGESMAGPWIYSHCDHKPENCLVHEGRLAVLDWDECNLCHPRLEAVAAALRWAGSDAADPEKLCTFLHGYNESGMLIENLQARDFAKWLAELISWFCFQTERSLGVWPEVNQAERAAAAEMAYDVLTSLQVCLDALPRWTRFL